MDNDGETDGEFYASLPLITPLLITTSMTNMNIQTFEMRFFSAVVFIYFSLLAGNLSRLFLPINRKIPSVVSLYKIK
jgi:hypothetical protein